MSDSDVPRDDASQSQNESGSPPAERESTSPTHLHTAGGASQTSPDEDGEPRLKAKDGAGDGHIELRFLIASKTAGAIIGKAGANIKRLREAFHARISVPDSDGPDRVVTVECARESVRELLTELFQALLDDEKRNAAQVGSATTGGSTLTDADARMLIHQSQAGCLIGKEGAKIKQLRAELALRVFKIFPECCPRSTERVVQMLGEPRAIVDAVLTVHQLLAANPPKGPRFAYNPGMVDAMQNAYGGWPVPYTASFPHPGPPANHSMPAPPRRGAYAPSGPGLRRGGPAPRGGSASPYRSAPPGAPAGGAPVYGGFDLLANNPAYPQYTSSHDGMMSTQVSLPDRLTGCIMGRGGQRIQQIRADSGAEIRVDNPQQGRDRVITIRGTMQQIQTAQFLLQQCVRKFGGVSQ